MRFYPGYTAATALGERWGRFWALYGVVPQLQAAEDLRRLGITHAKDPRQLGQSLQRQAGGVVSRGGGRSEYSPAAPGLERVERGKISEVRRQKLAEHARRQAVDAASSSPGEA